MAMKTITFSCETITPMFLSGADGSTPELRPPSIKGALRFWWRAMNGGKDNMREEEAKIFGGTEPAQRSKVIVRISPNNLKKSSNKLNGKVFSFKKWQKDKNTGQHKEITIIIDLLEYLCYGTYEYEKGKGNVFKREYFLPNQKFEVNFTFVDNQYIPDIVNSFCLLANFGGLGARSRNGFGNFKITKANIELPNIDVLLKELKTGTKKSFTAFSNDLQIFETASSYPLVNNKGIAQVDIWKKALSDLASAYRASRSSLEDKHSYSKRIYIASPLIADKQTHSFLERHSKSFFLSIIEENNEYKGRILYLPYLYLESSKDYSTKRREDYDSFNSTFCELLLQNQLIEVTL
jgi:CRISPR-associated protein Cmr1